MAEDVLNEAGQQPGLKKPEHPDADSDIPGFFIDLRPRVITLPPYKDIVGINVRYPLIPPYAFAHIFWDDKRNELVYQVEESPLDDIEKELLKLIKVGLEEMINISFIHASKSNLIIKYLEKNVQSILLELGAKVSRRSYQKIMYYIYRDFVGLNEIEPLMNDYYIEDVECNGVGTPIYIVHRKYQNLRTNLIYRDMKQLVDFVEKLAQKTGRYVSFAKPLLDGSLPDGSRVNATYTSDITTHGPTFTIRKFTIEPMTPIHLIGYETASPEVFAYIWLAIEHKFNLLTIGETASGKTTFLNSVLQFVPEEARIVSIEDTRELALVHENWIPAVSRAGFGIPNILGQQYGEITLFDLLRETFRQNPDYVVVGEVRGKETYILFQGMASVPGDQKVLVLNDEHPKRIPIGEMSENVKYKAITIDTKDGKVKILPVAAVMRHPARSELFRIKMKSGREITTTGDHSLFTYFDGGIVPIRADCLALDSKIVVPALIPCGYADIKHINLLDLPDVRVFAPKVIRRAVGAVGYDKACDVCGVRAVSDYYADFSDCLSSSLGVERFKKLVAEAKVSYSSDEINVKFLRKSKSFPAELELSGSLLKLMGYYISEGSLNDSGKNSSICLYNSKKEILDDMRKCVFGVIGEKPKERVTARGFGSATELRFSHKVLFEFLKHYCNKGSHNKRIPDFVFGLSKERISKFVSALFTGDGHVTKSNIGYSTVSRQLAEDVMQLLLVYGIVARRYWNRSKKLYSVLFYFKQDREEFLKHVAILGRNIPVLGKSRMMRDGNKIGDVYLDQIKSVEKIKLEAPVPVFDLCVPGTENFIGNGVMLHNSGHPSYSTFHAASVETLVRRLETPPINLPASLVDSLDIVVSAMHIKDQKRNFRRIRAVEEIIRVQQSIGTVESNKLFEWDPIADKIIYHGNSFVFQNISKATGISVKELEAEMLLRAELLRKLYEQGISHYVEFNSIIHEYYKNPEAVLKRFGIVPSGRVVVAALLEKPAAAVVVPVKAKAAAKPRPVKRAVKRKR